MNICPKCGSESKGAFCPKCGSATQPAAPAAPAEPVRTAQTPPPQANAGYQTPAYQPQAYQAPGYQPQPAPAANVYVQNAEITEANLPARFKPLSPWAYFGYSLLLSIPIVGIVLLFVWTFNGSNINRRNWVRSFWCGLLIAAIAAGIVLLILLLTGSALSLSDLFNK